MTRNEMIQNYEKSLNEKINIVKKELDGLEGWMTTESYFGDVLDNPTAGGLSSFLGKMEKSSDIMSKYIPDVQGEIENCPLNPIDSYKITGGILNKLARDLEELCKHYKKYVAETKNPQEKRRRQIKEYFSKVYKNIVKEIFMDTMRSSYKGHGNAKKTFCGAPCEDGHPCQHLWWEGWICWQHGGGRKN